MVPLKLNHISRLLWHQLIILKMINRIQGKKKELNLFCKLNSRVNKELIKRKNSSLQTSRLRNIKGVTKLEDDYFATLVRQRMRKIFINSC